MSTLIKDIAAEASSMPTPEPENEKDILQRSLRPNPNKVVEEKEIPEKAVVTNQKVKPNNDIIALTNENVILKADIADLKKQLTQLTESQNVDYPEGATATNQETGQRLVFLTGKWRFVHDTE